ncbi:flagellin [Thorsellia anophelis]|uniref:Flagellin n=1 Tax=Thorsellia anophelis DSM 18579 TaxID=1123402 RepID=A0A1H9ZA80_9GAMM|nr:flagellin [Thorsellia anophelis]SES78464.1 flagellin [Thorsellia anophelis DSM 18579]
MPVINTNIFSIASQMNLMQSNSSLSTAIERLSSGLRINSAKDDAAGQSISNRFTTGIKGYSQAKRNAADGISILQTSEGAVSEINHNVQHIRTLTVQAENGSNSLTDRNSIQAEIRQRLDEIDRISAQTQFNGRSLLAKNEQLPIQTGMNDNQTVTINTQEMNTDTLGIRYLNVNTIENAEVISNDDAQYLTQISQFPSSALKVDLSSANDALTNFALESGLNLSTFLLDDQIYSNGKGNYFMRIDILKPNNDEATLKSLRIPTDTTPTTVLFAPIDPTSFDGVDSFKVKSININSINPGNAVDRRQYFGPNGPDFALDPNTIKQGETLRAFLFDQYNLSSPFPGDVNASQEQLTVVDSNDPIGDFPIGAIDKRVDNLPLYTDGNRLYALFKGGSAAGDIDLLTGQEVLIDITYYVDGDDFNTINSSSPPGTLHVLEANYYINEIQLTDIYTFAQDTANIGIMDYKPIAMLDNALLSIDTYRGELGAVMNRIESNINSIDITRVSLEAARSRIMDADYAVEVANQTKYQIMQQAGNSVLTQANQIPDLVLQLLK